MHGTELFLILLLTLCAVAYLAQRVNLASPIAFVIAGMALAVVPGLQSFEIPPEYLLFIFLPPLLTEAAYFTSPRDFLANRMPILQLAVGLVLMTALAVAFTVYTLDPQLGLAVGFLLGAIISPPDAVAAVSITRTTAIPRRIVTILEGESLINDATGLVLYKFAVAAIVIGSFSFFEASLQFIWMVISGLVFGWLIAWLYMKLFPRIKEMSVEILSTFLVPYTSYLLVETLHGSGVLAVVATGLTIGWYGPQRFSSTLRIPLEAVWRMVVFVLNGLVFLLIGLHFTRVLQNLTPYEPSKLLMLSIAVPLVAIMVRFAWVFAAAYGTRYFFPSIRRKAPYPPWQNVFVVAWTGIRGVVSVATALALPLTVYDGSPFPHRDLIIFLACWVVLATLVLQGISLPWIVRRLSLTYEFGILQEQWEARKHTTVSAMERLDFLKQDASIQSAALDRIVSHYKDRLQALGDGPNTPLNQSQPPTAENHPLIVTEQKIWKEVLDAERDAVVCLRQSFQISDDVMHEILRDIDLLHNRFANAA